MAGHDQLLGSAFLRAVEPESGRTFASRLTLDGDGYELYTISVPGLVEQLAFRRIVIQFIFGWEHH